MSIWVSSTETSNYNALSVAPDEFTREARRWAGRNAEVLDAFAHTQRDAVGRRPRTVATAVPKSRHRKQPPVQACECMGCPGVSISATRTQPLSDSVTYR